MSKAPSVQAIGDVVIASPALRVLFYTCADAFTDANQPPNGLVIGSAIVKAGLDIPELSEPVMMLIHFVCGSTDKKTLLSDKGFSLFANTDWVGVLEYVLKN